MKNNKCDICGTKTDVEFAVRSNHLTVHIERFFKELNVRDVTTNHINKHLCIKCFNNIFNMGVENNDKNRSKSNVKRHHR